MTSKVRKLSGLKADGTPNAYWRRFKERLATFDQTPLDEWGEEQILGYLLKRLSDHYKIEFALSYQGAPTKSPEMYCVRRMMYFVGSQKGWIIKDYIDWVFDTIIAPQKTKVDTLAFFFTKKICQRYRGVFAERQKITRSTELPPNYKKEAEDANLFINTYGELAFAKMALDADPERQDIKNLFVHLEDLGFSTAILERLDE